MPISYSGPPLCMWESLLEDLNLRKGSSEHCSDAGASSAPGLLQGSSTWGQNGASRPCGTGLLRHAGHSGTAC